MKNQLTFAGVFALVLFPAAIHYELEEAGAMLLIAAMFCMAAVGNLKTAGTKNKKIKL